MYINVIFKNKKSTCWAFVGVCFIWKIFDTKIKNTAHKINEKKNKWIIIRCTKRLYNIFVNTKKIFWFTQYENKKK